MAGAGNPPADFRPPDGTPHPSTRRARLQFCLTSGPPFSRQGRSRQARQPPNLRRSAIADDTVTTVPKVMKSGDSPESVPSGTHEFLREESGWPRYGDRQTSPIVPDPCSRAWRPGFHSPPHRRNGIAWERGRPARILSLWPPPSFSAMLQAATLSAGTASARPKESHGAVAG